MSSRSSLAVYTRSQRFLDWIFIILFFACEGLLIWRIGFWVAQYPILFVFAFVFGYLGADFLSGFVHWLGDTWGHAETPVVGSRFIRPFREHHVDQTAITRHSFGEVNGNNCLVSGLFLLVTLALTRDWQMSGAFFFGLSFAFWLSLGVFATNQFHKWAHAASVPVFIHWLQQKRLILSPEVHAVHHRAPYDRYYCITTGWLNSFLQSISFFEALERIIEWVSGVAPREEDVQLTRK